MTDDTTLASCLADSAPGIRPTGRRHWLAVLVGVCVGAFNLTLPSAAGFPEVISRGGRICGCGYGDGYHACHSSGVRPLANLPPRSFPARIGTVREKFQGCPQCGNTAFPGVDPTRSPAPDTFYHRFDRYARAVSRNAANIQSVKPLMDPEADAGYSYSQLDPDGNRREYSTETFPPPVPSEAVDQSVLHTEDPTTPPQMSEEELEEYRNYIEQKRLRKKFDKYLIDPEETEPNQIMGGPPVGSEERRRIDESKVERLKERMRRELAAEAEAAAEAKRQSEGYQRPSQNTSDATEDALPSPSDRLSPSILEMESSLQDELPAPLEQLLPPMNDATPRNEFPLDPIVDPLIPTRPESIPRGLEDRLDEADSAKPSRWHQTQTRAWIHQPLETRTMPSPSSPNRVTQPLAASEDPSHRIAALSRAEKMPPKSNFVKQPD